MHDLTVVQHRGPQFQSAPGLEAGRCRRGADAINHRPFCFNPRPALRPGDASAMITDLPPPVGFNPRPALRPGDAESRAAKRAARLVFQSAPGLEAGRCG